MDDNKIMKKASHVWNTASQELKNLSNNINIDSFLKCVKIIAGCNGHIITSGSGTSGTAAKKITHSLSCIERPSFSSPLLMYCMEVLEQFRKMI